MGSFLNHLNRLTEEAQRRKNEGSTLHRAFDELHSSFIEHIQKNISKSFSEHNHQARKKIFISIDSFTFEISSILIEPEQKIRLSIKEDSIRKKIIADLKFDAKKHTWKIRKISDKKMIYTMREMKPVMIEYFLIILTRYL